MRIVVIGAGDIGGTLTRLLSGSGHEVFVANASGPETLTDLVGETGATAVAIDDLPSEADVVLLALPYQAIPDLAHALGRSAAGAIIVDVANYVPGLRDPHIAEVDAGMAESRWVSDRIGRPVVKALNTITAASLQDRRRPPGAADRIGAPVSGDDERSKQGVIALVDQLGFDAFDAGSLDASWRQQPGTPVATTDLPLARARAAVAGAERGQTSTWRARMARREGSSPIG
jgi:predicted dinucleotide-binding enzyme